MNGGGRDALFIRVVLILVALIIAYALGITLVLVLGDPSDTTITRFISSFGAIWAGLLGLCTGYLIGGRNGNGRT